MAAPRARSGCEYCRARHLKCDEIQLACARCQASGIECVRGNNIRFKHTDDSSNHSGGPYQWLASQVWPRTNTSDDLVFLDETESTARTYEGDRLPSELSLSHRATASTHSATPRPVQITSIGTVRSPSAPISPTAQKRTSPTTALSPAKHRRLTDLSGVSEDLFDNPIQFSDPTLSTPSPGSQHHHHDSSHGYVAPANVTPLSNEDDASESLELMSLDGPSVNLDGGSPLLTTITQPIWPLSTIEEAQLMHYFVYRLAVRFDMCDPARHFATVVPQRASVCPPLLYAVFAVSARHLNKLSNYDSYAADRYHQKALDCLKTIMYDEAAVMDENILAATTILRFLEEIDVPLVGVDLDSHLVGTKALINAQESSFTSDYYENPLNPSNSLRQACFWIALRQEIYVAFVSLRSVHWNLARCQIDRSLTVAADDYTWANRIIVHCAEVLQFCFDDDHGDGSSPGSSRSGPGTMVTRWKELRAYCEEWMKSVPQSFCPIYYRRSQPNDLIPQIWHIGDAHVTGIQHYFLAMILLTVYDPTIPRLGPGVKAARAKMDCDIQDYVLRLSGLGVCNSQTPANLVPACMGITMAGERFGDRLLQEAFMSVLVKTEKEAAWPTKATQRSLKEAWGWEMNDSTEAINE